MLNLHKITQKRNGAPMDNFIVLGLVPGTNFQITFELWLQVATGLVGLGLLVYVYKLMTFPFPVTDQSRETLHANQLHRRA